MSGMRSLVLALALIAVLPLTAPAAPSVGALASNPSTVSVGIPATLTVTVEITDPTVLNVVLQRVGPTGVLTNLGTMVDNGTAGDPVAGDRIFTRLVPVNETSTGLIRFRVSAAFRGLARRITSAELGVQVGVVLAPNFAATIRGPAGTVLAIQPNTFEVEIVAGIAPTPLGTIVAPTGNLALVSSIDIILEPTEFTGLLIPPADPVDVSVPAPAGTPNGTPFIIAQQATVDAANGTGLVPRLLATAAAVVVNGQIVTGTGVPANPLPGVKQPGAYAVVTATGSGFVTGIVSDASGPVSGAIVSSNTNPLVDITDGDGRFNLFISGGPFTLTAFHALLGARGTASGTIAVHGSTVQANVTLAPLAVPVVARDGIRNAGFERCVGTDSDQVGNLTGNWAFAGDVEAINSFGPTGAGHVITPTEGKCMVSLSTSDASAGGTGSTLKQKFRIPAGVRTLSFDFNFVSEELEEWPGSAFNDAFEAVVTVFQGSTDTVVAKFTVARVEVSEFVNGGFTAVGDCEFPGGDDTCGAAGWRTATVDLSAFSGELSPMTAELSFSVVDGGDALYDTHVFIDNIRFGTVWVDAKVIRPSTATLSRIDRDVRLASEILSQAGLIVRLRPRAPESVVLNNPGGLDEVNLTFVERSVGCPSPPQRLNGIVTAEVLLAMGLARSAVSTDANGYYVLTSNRSVAGYAVGSDEFCTDVVLQQNGGFFIMDVGASIQRVLAHELTHLLVSPANARTTTEHGNTDPINIMYVSGAKLDGISRAQSANINRPNAPLVQP